MGQTHACVGLERNVTYFSVNKLLFARLIRDNGVKNVQGKRLCLSNTSV